MVMLSIRKTGMAGGTAKIKNLRQSELFPCLDKSTTRWGISRRRTGHQAFGRGRGRDAMARLEKKPRRIAASSAAGQTRYFESGALMQYHHTYYNQFPLEQFSSVQRSTRNEPLFRNDVAFSGQWVPRGGGLQMFTDDAFLTLWPMLLHKLTCSYYRREYLDPRGGS